MENLSFDYNILTSLPIDKIKKNNSSRTVKEAIYSFVDPTPVKNPSLISISKNALNLIDLDENQVFKKEFVDYFSGNKILNGSYPISHCYCGHQFGQFAGQLGDGRAITLGIINNNKGEKWELQLKGAGKTPYSRQADGRAVLRSSIREFLCSEAMYSLGIPTTRAGSLITSDTLVKRDPLYDGREIQEPCTIVSRLAPTFIRFGSFEITKTSSNTGTLGPSPGMHYLLTSLLNYLSKFYFKSDQLKNKTDIYQEIFGEIVARTAKLVAQWQCVGFCHGVLNTDNMSIIGITMDYGPFGFMEKYDPKFISNHSDKDGVYSYENQPKICYWNLTRLAESLSPIIPTSQTNIELNKYWPIYFDTYSKIMHKKLGLIVADSTSDQYDAELFKSLFDTMYATGADFTNTFRTLCQVDPLTNEHDSLCTLLKYSGNQSDNHHNKNNSDINESLNAYLNNNNNNQKEKNCVLWKKWLDKYKQRLNMDIKKILACKPNPQDKPDSINTLNPVHGISEWKKYRTNIMNKTNPKYVLRNWMAQQAIESAQKGDYSEINKQLKLLQDPYGLFDFDESNIKYTQSQQNSKLQVSCSS